MTPNEALQAAKDALDKALAQKQMNQDLIKSLGPAIIDALKPVLTEIADNSRVTKEELQAAIAGITINVPKVDVPQAQVEVKIPDIKIPQVNVTVPDIKIPEIKIPIIKVPKPEVTVNVPKIEIPDIIMPDEMDVKGWVGFMGYDKSFLKNPLPVQLRDSQGNPVKLFDNLTQIMGGGSGAGIGSLSQVGGRLQVDVISQPASAASITIADIFATTQASVVVNPDNRVRVELPTGSSGLTDTELRASHLDVQQLSGSIDSVVLTSVDYTSGGLNVSQVSGAVWSTTAKLLDGNGNIVSVQTPGDAMSAAPTTTLGTVAFNLVFDPVANVHKRMIGGSGEANGNALRTIVATDSVSSVIVNSGTITTVTTVGTVTNSVGAAIVDSSGVQYSTTNPIPTNNAQWGGAVVPAGLNETNAGVVRTVLMTDSVASVVVNSGTITTVTTLTGVTNTVNVRLDTPDGAYSAANPMPTTLVSGGLTSTIAVGAVVAGAADDGSAPIKTGGIARTANPSAVTGGQQVSFSADKIGRQITRPVQVRDLIATAYVSLTNGTEATLLAAGGTGVFNDLIYVLGANSSDAAVMVDIRDVTAGNIVTSIEIPANGTSGVSSPVPYPQGNANNNWTVDMPDITGTTVNITALFSKEI